MEGDLKNDIDINQTKISRQKVMLSVSLALVIMLYVVVPWVIIYLGVVVWDFVGLSNFFSAEMLEGFGIEIPFKLIFISVVFGLLLYSIFYCWRHYTHTYKQDIRRLFEGNPPEICDSLQPNVLLRETSKLMQYGDGDGEIKKKIDGIKKEQRDNLDYWTYEAFQNANLRCYLKKEFFLLKSTFLEGVCAFVCGRYCVITKDFQRLDPVMQEMFFYLALTEEKKISVKLIKYLLYICGKAEKNKWIFSLPNTVFESIMAKVFLEKENETRKCFKTRHPLILNQFYSFKGDDFFDGIQTISSGIKHSVDDLNDWFFDKILVETGFNHSLLEYPFLKYFAPCFRVDITTPPSPTVLRSAKELEQEVEEEINWEDETEVIESEFEEPEISNESIHDKKWTKKYMDDAGEDVVKDERSLGSKIKDMLFGGFKKKKEVTVGQG